ncbi:hypothetical protein K4A83_15550 [Spirulina subsalsa FACHB-351]|uniref:Uncharacterized protein n=1 Tax=Spirulina subsalsa FACHB-351 TaxID=234711 RepID=A0ABT3L951_9CYAN|nr:hypothetical protein [Spirulina subsalsa]MCW6037677.1 hypothetical protein [Spirulina subsalsa FACHB-351]
MMLLSPRKVYHNLALLEKVDVATSALYRQQAQEVLADESVSLTWRQAIAHRLNDANHRLELKVVSPNDSY